LTWLESSSGSEKSREKLVWSSRFRIPFRCGSLPIAEHSSGHEEEEGSIAAVEIRNSYAPALPVRIGKGIVVCY
jgi:hypothetical protein